MGSIQLYEGHSDSNVVHSAIPPVSQSSWDAKIYFYYQKGLSRSEANLYKKSVLLKGSRKNLCMK